jgi:phosphonate transport system substrate-binding protein
MSGAIHGALFPPGEYLRAHKADPCMKVVGTTLYGTSTSYTTNIIVRRDSKIMVPGDLRGKRVAFSSPSSASGYIFATKFLAERGLLPGVDYHAVFTGGHQETIRAVELGTVDAGATFGRALGTEVKFGRELSEVSILAIAGQIPNEPLAFSSLLSPDLVNRISTAFLGLNNMTADGRRLLGDQEMMSGWVPSDDSTYDGLRETVEDVDRVVRAGDGGTEVER